MSATTRRKGFYVVREVEWTVVVDTDNESVANLVALGVREEKGGFTEPGSIPPPKAVREMMDPHVLGDPEDHEGTKYWVI